MKKHLIITYEIETEDFEDLRILDDLTLEEAVEQSLLDGNLDLENMIVSHEIRDIEIEDICLICEKPNPNAKRDGIACSECIDKAEQTDS